VGTAPEDPLRADSGFFEDNLLSFLEERYLSCIVVARLTKWINARRRVSWNGSRSMPITP
jgi:hypothetical protein